MQRGAGQRRLGVARPARDALRVQVLAGAQVGERGMRKQQVARGEAAVQLRRQAGAAAEEGDLEAVVRVAVGAQLAGDVPPLDGRAQVRAVVARKVQRAAAAHRLVGRLRKPGAVAASSSVPRQSRRRTYQSSFTDSSAAREAAARAL